MTIEPIRYEDAVASEGDAEQFLVSRHLIGDLEVRHLSDYQGQGAAITVVGPFGTAGVLILPTTP